MEKMKIVAGNLIDPEIPCLRGKRSIHYATATCANVFYWKENYINEIP